MAAVFNMMPVSLPLFASASSADATGAKAKQNDAGFSSHMWGDSGGDGIDFDMLAEYLLEDGPGVAELTSFDFSNNENPHSSIQYKQQAAVVSPEHVSDASLADQKVDHAVQTEVKNSPAAAPSSAPKIHASSGSMHVLTNKHAAMQLGMSSNSIPTLAPYIASTAVSSPPMSAHGIALAPVAPGPPSAAPIPAPIYPALMPAAPVPVPAPAPLALAPAPVRMLPPPNGLPPPPQPLLPGAALDSNKRRRIDAASAPIAVATTGTVSFNGHAVATGTNGGVGRIIPQMNPQRPGDGLVGGGSGGGGRQKSQAQIDRRRERNRILARRTRLRKKFFFESLQKDVTDLQQENTALKEIVRTRLDPGVAKSLLDECNALEGLPSIVLEQCGVPSAHLARQDFNLIHGIQKSQQSFVITDPSLHDNPIVYASEDFLTLTGYSREEILGRNCRFLQGTETSPAKVAQIRKAIAAGEDCSVTLINYTADGVAFWNSLFIAALRDAQNNIVNFIGVIVKVPGPDTSDPEAGKRLPGEVGEDDGLDFLLGGAGGDGHGSDSGCANDNFDAAAVAQAADGTVKAIEGVVTAALVTTPATFAG